MPIGLGFIQTTDHWYLVQKRFGLETHDVREFLTPGAAKVVEYATGLYDENPDTFILNCWEWVCYSFDYAFYDIHLHRLEVFVGPYRQWKVYKQEDLWHFPVEMIGFYEEAQQKGRRPVGDCDDAAFLLTSLLICGGVNAWANIGYLDNTGHAWTSVERFGKEYLLEATLSASDLANLIDNNPWQEVTQMWRYTSLYKFNQTDVKALHEGLDK